MVKSIWKTAVVIAAWVLVAVLGYIYFAGKNPQAKLEAIAPISQFEQLRSDAQEVLVDGLPLLLQDGSQDIDLPDELGGFLVTDEVNILFDALVADQIKVDWESMKSQADAWPQGVEVPTDIKSDLKVTPETYHNDWLRIRGDNQAGVEVLILLEFQVESESAGQSYGTVYTWPIEFIVDGPSQSITSIVASGG